MTTEDVSFAFAMVAHHEQGIALAELALKTVQDQAVRAIAQRIIDAQSLELRTLREWIDRFGANSSGHQDHAPMTGMLSQSDMDRFATLTGEQARTEFLRLMMLHHEGAVEMAQHKLETVGDGTLTDYAKAVIVEQSAEIVRMTELQGL
ncbi:MAG: DUF305 domain-containing protein [Agromyces sp.]